MVYYCYILYSKKLDKYYIGYTENLEERLLKHNLNHKGYTGRTDDWGIVYFEEFDNKKDAYALKRYIKRKKSRKYIEYLIQSKSD
ncbi:MAG: GIY-YIG nuclease family protein [Bacteroidales bacterium]|nr:GIY-YIG nuclease family protein [Bacteroidales bacterium]